MAADRAKESQSPQVPKGCWCQEPVTAGDGGQNRFYRNNHCEKYRNFTWFTGVEILRKGTVSA